MFKKYLIVIVDDDPDDCDLLAAAFRENYENVSVLTFNSADDFFAFMDIGSTIPSFIITDLYMPRTGGMEIIQKLKQNPHTSLIPVAIISTIKHHQLALEGTKLGTTHYFIKPNTLIEFGVIADEVMIKLG